MQKSFFLVLSLLLSFSVACRQDKKSNIFYSKSSKKYETFKIKDQSRSGLVSFDGSKNLGETLNQLKRRYPRKYNLKYNIDRLERDDFGYEPVCSKYSYKKSFIM